MFRALTGPSSGVSLAVIMLPFGSCSVVDCSCVRGGGLVVLMLRNNGDISTTRPTPRTHEQSTTLQEPNGSIITGKDTPDDGPVRARNM
jgi:hypothetical protein